LRFILAGAKTEESIAAALNRCGTTYEKVLRPFLQGVFLTDPDQVDAGYGHLIIKSFVNGCVGIPRLGVAQLSNVLAKRVSNIEYNTRVDRINGSVVHTANGDYTADKILVATDAITGNQLLGLHELPRMAGCITWYHSATENPSGTGRLVIDAQNRGARYNSIAKYEIPAALPVQSVGRALSQSIKLSDRHFIAGDHRMVPSQQGALFSGRLAAQLILN